MQSVLLFVHDIYEDLELWYPKIRMDEAGFKTVLAGPEKGKTYLGKHGYPCASDLSIQNVDSSEYSAAIVPGGYAPDKLRRDGKVLDILREMNALMKPIAFICHAGWVPISAQILKGKKVTGASAIKDDFENAGAHFLDKEVVVDGNLISSRSPKDLPAFCKAILKALA